MSTRPTAELVLLVIVGTIGAVLVISVVGLVVLSIIRPDANLVDEINAIAHTLDVLVGVVVGYLVGARRVGSPRG